MASFSNASEGWIAYPDLINADLRLTSTRDGSTWRRLPQRDLFTQAIQYINLDKGFAFSRDIYTHAAVLHVASVSGQRWKDVPLPSGFTVHQMRFTDARQGYLAGCLNRHLAVLSTGDGGSSWSNAALPSPAGQKDADYCAFNFDGLSLTRPGEAWLLASKHSFGLGDTAGMMKVWRTVDAGSTWTETYHEEWTEDLQHGESFAGPYTVGPGLMLIFRDKRSGGSDALVSDDGGRTWASTPVKHPIAGCVSATGSLICAGGDEVGFWTATVVHRK